MSMSVLQVTTPDYKCTLFLPFSYGQYMFLQGGSIVGINNLARAKVMAITCMK